MAPQWAAFVGLTALVVSAFLALARFSQQFLDDEPTVQVTPAAVDPAVAASPGRVSATVPDEGPASLPTAALLANVALTQGVFAVVLVGGALAFEIPAGAFGAADLLGQATGPPLLVGVGLGVSLWLASEGGSRLADAAGLAHDESLRGMLAPSSLGGWIVLLLVVLPVIAGVEELVFRAAAIGVVTAGFGTSPWAMALVSSIAFGIGHGAQGKVGIAVTGVLGFVLAAGFVVTGSLLTVVVAHYLVNALEFVVHEGLGG